MGVCFGCESCADKATGPCVAFYQNCHGDDAGPGSCDPTLQCLFANTEVPGLAGCFGVDAGDDAGSLYGKYDAGTLFGDYVTCLCQQCAPSCDAINQILCPP